MELTFYIWENDAEAGPYTLTQMRSIWLTDRITLNSIVRQETDSEWSKVSDFEIIYAPSENGSENKVIQRVVVADFDMPFSNMVIFITTVRLRQKMI
jgi:hypothetical protein